MNTKSDSDAQKLKEMFNGLDVIKFRNETTLILPLQTLRSALEYSYKTLGYNFLLDVSSLDHGEEASPRFEVVYELTTALDEKHLRVRSPVQEEEEVVSVSDLWKTANWHEREVYDMMGIRFTKHPDLRRILMWEGFPHFPLRKDFPLAGVETELPDVAFSGVAPLEGGPFVASPGGSKVTREPRAR